MTRILRIDASARQAESTSSQLANHFIERWMEREPQSTLTSRDLVASPVPHIESATIEGYYAAPEAMSPRQRSAVALSDRLIAELRDADVILIATPMYNFSIPSALKAWIDHIVRIGQTFSYDGTSFSGLLPGKRAFVLMSAGASGYSDPKVLAAADFLQPYLRFLLGFLGITDMGFVSMEGTTGDAAALSASRARALTLIDGLVDRALASARAA